MSKLRLPMSDRSVRARLLAINALLIIAQCTVCAIAWHFVEVQNRAMSDLALISKAARYHQDADTLSANIRADVSEALASATFASVDATVVAESLEDHIAELRTDLRTLARIDLPSDLAESLSRLEGVADAFVSRATFSVTAVSQNWKMGAQGLPQFKAASDSLAEAMEQQTGVFASRIVAANELAVTAATTAKLWLIAASVVTTVLVAGLVALVGGSIRRSLQKVRDVAQDIASGNLAVRNDETGGDEIGQLAHAINQMADSLNDVIGRLRADAERETFSNQLGDALDATDSESAAYGIITRAMQGISPTLPMELLVSDSSRSHLERAAQHPTAGTPGCDVESPYDCLAVRRGSTQTFPDSEALNACVHLRGRACPSVSAVCVPLSSMGRSIGVLHAATEAGKLPTPKQIEQLSALGAQAGARIGTVRAFQRTQTQASTDSLTGLTNRRAAEEAIRALMAERKSYAFVLCDLDHFKRLNDQFGHEAGDAALRLYSDVLRRVVRERDLAARWGGEEFVIILREGSAENGAEFVERLRAALRTAVAAGSVPSFTASFGIADSSMGTSFRQVARLADDALYRAKDSGRNCAIIADPHGLHGTRPRHATEHPAAIDIAMLETGSHPPSEWGPSRQADIDELVDTVSEGVAVAKR